MGLTREQGHYPDEGNGTDGPLVGGHVAQRETNGVPPVQRDESQCQHGDSH